MSRARIHAQIADLKKQLKAENKKINDRLIRLALVMLVLLIIAGYIYGKIHL
jgi:hypothetical protein